MIDETSYTPKYIQLKELLKEYIVSKGLQEGDSLPSENELLKKYQVSRNTVRQAFNLLDKEGVIYTVRGKGTFYKGVSGSTGATSSLIGVMTPVSSVSIYLDILNGIEQYAHENRYQMIWSNTMANPEKERAVLESMLEKGIDGLIIEPALSSNIVKDSYIYKRLQNLPIPFVIIDCCVKELEAISITLDDCRCGYLAADYLIQRHHKRIGYIFKHETIAGKLRYEGYVKALLEAGLPLDPQLALSFTEDEDQNTEYPVARLTKSIMERRDPPTALFYFNDEMAFEGIQSLRSMGCRVPEDVSVIGIDDSQFALFGKPGLTTLAHPKGVMGRQAAELLIKEIKTPGSTEKTCLFMQPEIIERDSIQPLVTEA